MGITKEAKLQRQLDDAESHLRNANSSLAYLRTQREEAIEQRDKATKLTAHLDAINVQHRQHIRRLFNSIFHLNLDSARKAGYIDRVKEMDAQSPEPIIEPEIGGTIDRERDNLAGARSGKMVASVIDGMDPDILDQVLGRDDVADYDRG